MASFSISSQSSMTFTDLALSTQAMNVFVSGTVTSTSLSFSGLYHTFPDDLDMVLYAPDSSRNLLFMSDCGSGDDLNYINLTFSDGASGYLPDTSAISTGSYSPTNYDSAGALTESASSFGLAAPLNIAGPNGGSTFASAFGGTALAGNWTLAVRDDASSDSGGTLAWALNFTTLESSTLISGGAGADQLSVANGAPGDGTMTFNGQSITYSGVDRIEFAGGGGNDSFSGGSEVDVINGGAGADTLLGAGGDDIFIVERQADDAIGETYSGGTGFDTLAFGKYLGGNYTIDLSNDFIDSIERITFEDPDALGLAEIRINASQIGAGLSSTAEIVGSIFPYASNNFIIRMDASNVLNVQGFNFQNFEDPLDRVTVEGTGGNDDVTGSSLEDDIYGNNGNDVIDGRDGDDVIEGRGGNDWLIGGAGSDRILGGSGSDTIVYDANDDPANILGGADIDMLLVINQNIPVGFNFIFHEIERANVVIDDVSGLWWSNTSDYYIFGWTRTNSDIRADDGRLVQTTYANYFGAPNVNWQYITDYRSASNILTNQDGKFDDGTLFSKSYDYAAGTGTDGISDELREFTYFFRNDAERGAGLVANVEGYYDDGRKFTQTNDVDVNQLWTFQTNWYKTDGVTLDFLETHWDDGHTTITPY